MRRDYKHKILIHARENMMDDGYKQPLVCSVQHQPHGITLAGIHKSFSEASGAQQLSSVYLFCLNFFKRVEWGYAIRGRGCLIFEQK